MSDEQGWPAPPGPEMPPSEPHMEQRAIPVHTATPAPAPVPPIGLPAGSVPSEYRLAQPFSGASPYVYERTLTNEEAQPGSQPSQGFRWILAGVIALLAAGVIGLGALTFVDHKNAAARISALQDQLTSAQSDTQAAQASAASATASEQSEATNCAKAIDDANGIIANAGESLATSQNFIDDQAADNIYGMSTELGEMQTYTDELSGKISAYEASRAACLASGSAG
jgi:hypothetical protein